MYVGNMDDQAYQDEIRSLKAKLKDAESKMFTAATYGKTLLEETLTLKSQIALMQKQRDSEVEGLTQEIYSLRSKNEMLHNAAENQKEDMDVLTKKCQDLGHIMEVEAVQKQRLSQEKAELEAELLVLGERTSQAEKEKCLLERKISEMEMDFGRQSSELQINQDQKLVQLEEENRQQLAVITSTKEVVAQRDEVLENLTNKCATLNARVAALKEELESKQCEAIYYANSMEQCRQEMLDMKVDVKVENEPEADVNKRGNSLFSEIEDRRQLLEKQATRMREKYLAMKAAFGPMKTQLWTLNLRVASLERNMSHKVDASYAERLEDDLATANREVDALRARVQFYNASVDDPKGNSNERLPQTIKSSSEYSFLSVMLAQEKQRVTQQEEEKKRLYNKYVMARDEAQEYRRLLYHKEKVYGGVQAENIQLRAEKEALLDKSRVIDDVESPEIAASPLQTDATSNVAFHSTSPIVPGDPLKLRPDVANGKENTTTTYPRSAYPVNAVRKNDCKQQ